MSIVREKFISIAEKKFGPNYEITAPEIIELLKENSEVKYPQWLATDQFRVSRGVYKIPSLKSDSTREQNLQKSIPVESKQENTVNLIPKINTIHNNSAAIPQKDETFEKFGYYNDLKKIISKKIFYPVFIVGLSGSGKTLLSEQVCSELGREMIRLNFSVETDQSDMLGGPTLIDGNIKFIDGPVIQALKNGWVLLLDEVDRCLEENEEVRVGTINNWTSIKLKDLQVGVQYPIISYNLETSKFENDLGEIINESEEDLYLVEFEDGSSITLTSDHPFITSGNVEKTIDNGLSVGDLVIFME